MQVQCNVPAQVSGDIAMVVNDDGKGGQTTVECNTANNRDDIKVSVCYVK
jgi:hypothetical protein